MNITIPKMPERTITLPTKTEILKGLLIIGLSGAEIFGMRPFGLCLAATLSAESAYIAILSLCLGVIGGGVGSVRYLMAFLIYYILVHLKKREDVMERTVRLSFSVLAAGAISTLWSWNGWESGARVVAEMVIAGGTYYLFTKSGEKTTQGNVAKLIITGGVLCALSKIILPYINVNLGMLLTILMCATISYSVGMSNGVLAAAIIGFLANMADKSAFMYLGIFVLCAFLASALSGLGKYGVAVGVLSGICAGVLYMGSSGEFQPAVVFLALSVFCLVPERMHFKVADTINKYTQRRTEEAEVKEFISRRLKVVSRAVSDLADGISRDFRVGRDDKLLPDIFSAVPERICTGCSLFGSCSENDGKRVKENMTKLWHAMEVDGYLDHDNIPSFFCQVCLRCESFLREFSHIYELHKQNRLHYGEAASGRSIMARQYSEISGVIDMISEEIYKDEREDAQIKYEPQVTFLQEAKNGQRVCGDAVMEFSRGSKYFVILADGMGTGMGALSESQLVARLFAEFLKAGFEKEKALKMINSALCLNIDRESFSAVDILEIDTETGEAEFLKIGSAESFIKTKSEVLCISSKSLPVGILEDVETAVSKAEVKTGDMIVMVSDGIGEAGHGVLKNDWIKKILSATKENPQGICEKLIKGAKARSKFSDDMTCVVVKIKRYRG